VSGRRRERLAGEIHQEVARMIGAELKDPRLGFVTVTRVDLTADLRYARIFVGVLGSADERGRTVDVLRGAAGFVRKEIGRRLRLRFAPEIDFRYDKGLDATDRVARLLEEAATSTAEPGAPGPVPDSSGEDEPD